MKMLRIVLGIFLFVFIAWTGWGYVTSSVETPTTIQTLQYKGFELRTLPAQLIATVQIDASSETDASSKGFRALADFIFGNNTTADSIKMTAPVTATASSTTIAMTAPVTSNKTPSGQYEVSFIMPSKWTMETLPVPNNDAVQISEQPSRQIAVYTFGGYATQSAVSTQKQKFTELLSQSDLKTQGEITLAQYNDPMTPPWMRTNELWMDVVSK